MAALVEYFKATADTKRFNLNQKIWISLNCANHLLIYFKYRGSGRYVTGQVDKFSPIVGEIKSIQVSSEFSKRIKEI